LLLKAAQEHNIDLENSLMIGDSQTDILAAKNAGCNSILLKKNQRLVDLVREFAS
jgi:D-glycero-D-manno-heptose 1,7-bisphosphate phosphatase